jgi:hypothetical protein
MWLDLTAKIRKQRTVMEVNARASWGAAVLRPYTDSAVMMRGRNLLICRASERIRKTQNEVEVDVRASWGAGVLRPYTDSAVDDCVKRRTVTAAQSCTETGAR